MRTAFALTLAVFVALAAAAKVEKKTEQQPMSRRPRLLDQFATHTMMEEGARVAAAPECRFGLGWIYHDGYCYIVTSYHQGFDEAEAECEAAGGYLADVLSDGESSWLKGVLEAVNPADGTDYFIGGTDLDADGNMIWMTGAPFDYNDFVDGEPAGQPYIHLDYDLAFRWNTKNDADDQDNGFVCKRPAV